MNQRTVHAIAVACSMLLATAAEAQIFTNQAGSNNWRTNNTGTAITHRVALGNLQTTPYPSVFQIHGELLPAAWQTPEVFRTNAPTTASTYWRMFQGGTGAGNERGQLFADPANTNFNINAPNGNFLLHTQNVARARLSGNVTSPMGAGDPFPNVNRDGYLLLSGVPAAFTDPNSRAPFTRLHLVDQQIPGAPPNYAQQQGFRPWQRNGITLTGNNDQSYIGHKYNGTDVTDLVVQWSDNPNNTFGTDRMKFVFTTQYNPGVSRGAASLSGVEAMRLFPATYDEVHVGIGDFAQTGLAEPDPTERLDMLDRTIRLRRMVPDYNNDTITRVVVVDTTGRLHWRRINTWPSTGTGTADCKWTLLGTGNANIATAYAGNPGCPQYDRFVGIGTNAPSAKLHVKWTGTAGVAHASQFAIDGTSYGKRGGEFSASGTGSLHAGLRALASGASSSLGVEGNMAVHARAEGTVSVARNRGLFSEALVYAPSTVGANLGLDVVSDCNSSTTVTENYGVKAVARTFGASTYNYGGLFSAVADDANATVYGIKASAAGGDAALRWAGWFDGNIWVQNTGYFTNGTVLVSDQGMKTEIEDLTGALAKVNQLQPKTYLFNTDEYPMMGLSAAPQIGLLAQEVQQVVPEAVSSAVYPAQRDSMGNETSAAFPVMGIDYTKLIPVLIGAIKEQQVSISSIQQQLAATQQQLVVCCNRPTDSDHRMAPTPANASADELLLGQERLLRIAPNPFTDRTTLYYTTERSGRVQLLANSADGRDLRILSEAQREAGAYQFEWGTENLAPGVYYVTLLLDGEPLVKRAVKVGR